MRIAVISSIYGRYDHLVPPVPQDVGCEWVLVADEPYHCPPWRCVVEPRPLVPPLLASRLPKCRPDAYAQADVYLWVDASIQILTSDFVSWAVGHVEPGNLALFRHSHWHTIAHERQVAASLKRYGGWPMLPQVRNYLAHGFPDGWGHWTTGIIAYHRQVPPVLGDRWLREQVRWTPEDQLSLAPLLFEMSLRPVDLGPSIYDSPRFVKRPHAPDLLPGNSANCS